MLLTSIAPLASETPEENFKKQSSIEILNNLSEILSQNKSFYEEAEFINGIINRRNSFTLTNIRDTKDFEQKLHQNTFYGTYGIIRCLGTIFYMKSPEVFNCISFIRAQIYEEIANNPKKYELILLKLLYLLKQNENSINYYEILELLCIINKKYPSILPGQISVYTLDKILKTDLRAIQFITKNDGKLGEIARELIKIKERVEDSEEKVYSKDDIFIDLRKFRTMSEELVSKWNLVL